MNRETLVVVWEYLLRMSIDNSSLASFVTSLPIPENLPEHVEQSFFIRSLTFYPIGDKTLRALEKLHKFHRSRGTIKSAYCAVALHVSVRDFNYEGMEKFVKLVDGFWKGKIGELELGEERELVGDDLRRARTAMERVVDCEAMREKMRKTDLYDMAAKAISAFTKEAVEALGLTEFDKATKWIKTAELLSKQRTSGGSSSSHSGIVHSNQTAREVTGPENAISDWLDQILCEAPTDSNNDGVGPSGPENSKKMWTLEEETALRIAAEQYHNVRKDILKNCPIFQGRSRESLRNKHRHMTKKESELSRN